MKLWTSLTGLIQAELLTADPAGALCAIADAGIALRDVTPEGELCLRFSVARPSYGRLLRLTRKRGETLTILGRTGLYWRFRALAGRPVLLAGLALLLCAQILIPTRIFFVRVSGNQRVPARQILAGCALGPTAGLFAARPSRTACSAPSRSSSGPGSIQAAALQ